MSPSTALAQLVPAQTALARAGQAADHAAAHHVFADYQARLAPNTRRRQAAALDLFAEFLTKAGIEGVTGEALASSPGAWEGLTWGVVQAFVRWLLGEGYAVGTINGRLSVVRRYAALAHQVGALPEEQHSRIQRVKGYGHREGRNLDEGRETTRVGAKKARATSLTKQQAAALKQQPDTPQGRRDALLMCLLLDHGLRCGEVAELEVQGLTAGTRGGNLTFYRRKVDKTQTHNLTPDTLKAARAYLGRDAAQAGPLLLGSRRGGVLGGMMSERAISARVRALGEALGLKSLSPHDCRHHWATMAMRGGTDIKALQEAGGWNSPHMPLRYAEAARVANEGVRLG